MTKPLCTRATRMKTDSKQTKMLLTKKTDLLKLLHLPTVHGLLQQKRMRWVGHTLRRADSDLSKGGVTRVGTDFKTMDKVPVGRHEGAQHQEHKSSGRHLFIFPRRGNYSVQEVAHILRTEGSALIELHSWRRGGWRNWRWIWRCCGR